MMRVYKTLCLSKAINHRPLYPQLVEQVSSLSGSKSGFPFPGPRWCFLVSQVFEKACQLSFPQWCPRIGFLPYLLDSPLSATSIHSFHGLHCSILCIPQLHRKAGVLGLGQSLLPSSPRTWVLLHPLDWPRWPWHIQCLLLCMLWASQVIIVICKVLTCTSQCLHQAPQLTEFNVRQLVFFAALTVGHQLHPLPSAFPHCPLLGLVPGKETLSSLGWKQGPSDACWLTLSVQAAPSYPSLTLPLWPRVLCPPPLQWGYHGLEVGPIVLAHLSPLDQ